MSEVRKPEGWEEARLDDVAQLVRGITFPTTAKGHEPREGAVACLRTANVQADVEWDDLWYVPRDYVKHDEQYVQSGDILISTANSYELVGKVARVKAPHQEASLGAFISLLRAEAGVCSTYFYYLMSSDAIQRAIREMASTTTNLSNVSGGKLKELQLLIAPSAEQTRIVEKLEELLSDLDAGVAELKAAQRKLAQYRQSLLKAAVEGALTAEWRVACAKASEPQETGAELLQRILTERRIRWETRQLAKFAEQGKTPPKDWKTKYPEPIAPDTTNLPELPESWVWASVEQLGAVQLGRQRSPDKMKGVCPVQYIRAANITEQGINFNDVLEMDFSETEIATFKLNAGDVLLTEASGSPQHVGRPVVWPKVDGVYCFQNTVIRFVPRGIDSNYAFCIFQAWQKLGVFQKLSGGVGINHLSAGKFLTVPVPLPSREEQNAIVDSVGASVVLVDEQGLAIEHSLKQATAQRRNILKVAFAGQLVPQDPNDEPASSLLERIRANRTSKAAPRLRGGKARKSA